MSEEIELRHLEFEGGPFDGWSRPTTEDFCEELHLEDGTSGPESKWYLYKLDRKEFRNEDGNITEVGYFRFVPEAQP